MLNIICGNLFRRENNFASVAVLKIGLLVMFSSWSFGDILTQDFVNQLHEAQSAIEDHKTMVQNLTEARARVETLEAELETIKNRRRLHELIFICKEILMISLCA